MMKLGLTGTERGVFEKALRSSHVRRIEVEVCNLNGDPISSIAEVFLGGQVTVDMDAEVTRTATLNFLDPKAALSFDTDSPDDGAIYADRMVRVRYGVFVEGLGRWVWCPVFLGPVTKLSRSGETVTVEAQGKETLYRGAIWRTLTLKKHSLVLSAIKRLLDGEDRYDFPEIGAKIPATRSLDRFAERWATAKKYAASVNRQLFFNGAGLLVLRALPGTAVYTFRTGDVDLGRESGADVLTPLNVSYEISDVRNVVVVKGKPPKGKKGRVQGVAIAPASHPLSPGRMGPTGSPRFLVERVEIGSIRTDKAARERAEQILEDRLREVVDVSFDSLPIPHLDPGDLVAVRTKEFAGRFRLRKFSIPLDPQGGVMPVGYVKRTTPSRKAIRR